MTGTWIEAALNGPWGRERQPGVPITIEECIEQGGHVRVGLEDAPLGSNRSNVEWVEHARAEIEAAGGSVATAADVRAELDG